MSDSRNKEESQFNTCFNQRIIRGAGILSEEIDDETVLFDPKNRNTYALNQMGSIVWQLCDGEHTPYEISDEISSVLGVDSNEVLNDVLELISELLDKKLVETN